MVSKRILLPVLGILAIGGTLFGAQYVSAQIATSTTPSIVQRIAEKFNLNQADVQAVFDEVRNEHHAQIKTNLETKLSQAVSDAKITDVQKQAILTKYDEMHQIKPDPETFKNMTQAERRQAFEQKRTELESWATQNGLELGTLQELMGHTFGFGHGMKGMMRR